MKHLAPVLGLIVAAQLALSAQYEVPKDIPENIRPPGGSTIKRTGPRTGPTPRLPDGTPDLNGVWVGGGPVNDLEQDGGLKPGEIDNLLLPWAKALMATRDVTQEPHNRCLPMGVPRTTPFPFRFVQNYTHQKPTHIFILQEGNIHTYRQIFMDGRPHPPDLDPTWYGHSIGTWEKDTLVVDTVGYNDTFWFDRRGHPHTEQLHTVERWTRLNMELLENRVTIDDPGAYTRPFTLRFFALLSAPDDLQEYICTENNQYGIESIPGWAETYGRPQ
ncbi:MAG: hypothetical protein HYU37_01745 [Acidobacteria bacterium]|nr:hypothetical protein [Acidobacteriota bacterium]